MRQKDHVWWVSATVLSLGAFSFFAGLGMRGLYKNLAGEGDSASRLPSYYPQIASAQRILPGRDNITPQRLFMSVLQKLELYYVDNLPPKTQQSYGAVDYMLNELKDPNTRLVSPVEMEAMEKGAAGQLPGLGAILTIRRFDPRTAEQRAAAAARMAEAEQNGDTPVGVRTLTIVSVLPGSPAEKAGLLPGDRITEFDQHWIAPAHVSYRVLTQLTDPLGPQDGRPLDPEEDRPRDDMPPAEREKARKESDELRARWKTATDLPTALQALYGAVRGEHEITVDRGTPAKTIKVKVSLDGANAKAFESRKLNDGTGYVRLLTVTPKTVEELSRVAGEFQNGGVKNLVLDLRNSAGGTLEAASDAAGILVGPARFAVLKEKGPAGKLVDRALETRVSSVRFKPQSIVVLVNGGTAGTAELLAAALREQAGAKLLGPTTFGDGTFQELVRLENGSGLSITRAKMLTSKGVEFDGKGLKPDTNPSGDPLEAAVKALAAAPAGAGGNA